MKKIKPWVTFYMMTIAAVLFLSYWGSQTVTVLAESSPPHRHNTIVIDPGHGGEDGGATSCTGFLESTYNLSIAIRLDDLFHLLGYDTRMVRTRDEAIHVKGDTIAQRKASDLRERVRIANETENAVLLSIHQNHFPDSRYSGAQVFYAGTAGSQELADILQKNFVSQLNPGSKRESKRSKGVYLMEHINCTGVLIECGFLSNPAEEARLREGEYQKKLCNVIVSSVSQFLSNT